MIVESIEDQFAGDRGDPFARALRYANAAREERRRARAYRDADRLTKVRHHERLARQSEDRVRRIADALLRATQ